MPKALADAVQEAAPAGDLKALTQLVADHGGAAIRLDGNPQELTTLHWAAASGSVEVVHFLLAPPVEADPRTARKNNFTRCTRPRCRGMQRHVRCCSGPEPT